MSCGEQDRQYEAGEWPVYCWREKVKQLNPQPGFEPFGLSPSARAFIIGGGGSTLALPQSANQAPDCVLEVGRSS